MRRAHGCVAILLCALVFAAIPARPAPKRVVSTFLCTDEYVFRLLPRERIAALSFEATDRHPVVSTIADAARGIPAIHPSAETVLALHPDLVVMYRDTMPALHGALAGAGVSVLDVPWANSLSDVGRITLWLGGKLGSAERARNLLAHMDNEIAAARALAHQRPVRTLIYEPNGYATSGGVTDEVMNIADLADVASRLRPTRAATLPVEAVIANAPELLILNGEPDFTNSRAALVQHHPALAALDGRSDVQWMNLTPMLCPGPWSLDLAPKLAALGKQARAKMSR